MRAARSPITLAALFVLPLAITAADAHPDGPAPDAGAEPGAREAREVVLTRGTNIAAALSPDGERIAFDLQGRIWIVPSGGGEATPITDPFGDARQPHWSPDGSRIAFQAYWTGTWHLWSVAPDGTDLRQLTRGPHDHREPAWSPDGERIAFSSDRDGSYGIWTLVPATGEVERLTEDEEGDEYHPAWDPAGGRLTYAAEGEASSGIRIRGPDGTVRRLVDTEGEPHAPSWSPDGRRIAYTEIGDGRSRLRVVRTGTEAGGAPRTLSGEDEDVFPFRASWPAADRLLYTGDGRLRRRSLAGGGPSDVSFRAVLALERPSYERKVRDFDSTGPRPVRGIVGPSVSPDGRAVAFAALGDLWIQEVGGELRRLTAGPDADTGPAWSPDGRRLAYVSDREGTLDLRIRDLETDDDRRVTDAPGAETYPAWAPEGDRLVYVDERPGGGGAAVRVVDLDSGRTRALRTGLFAPSRPSWSPDGRTVAVGALEPYSDRFREGVNRVLLLDARADSTGEARRLDVLPHRSLGTRTRNGPVWSPDGGSIAVVVSGLLHRVPVTPSGRVVGPPERLHDRLVDAPSWTGDGESLVVLDAGRLKRISVPDGSVEEIPVDLEWRRERPDGRYVVHAGDLWDGRSRDLRRNVDVWVDGHRIVRVEPHREHGDARVVDAGDGIVVPGFVETHSHQGRTTEELGRTWLAWGITTVRDPASNPHEAVGRRELWASGRAVGPRLFTAGYTMDGTRIYYSGGQGMESVAQLDEVARWARTLDYDVLKTYVRLPDRLQKRAVERAHEIGIPVTSHEIYPAVAYGADGVEHVRGTSRRGYSPKVSELYRSYQDVIALLAGSGMTITPTVGIYGAYRVLAARDPGLLDDPRLEAFVAEPTLESQRERARQLGEDEEELRIREEMVGHMAGTARRVVEAGGRVIAGTDAPILPMGHSFHLELQAYVELGGMSPLEALRSATTVAAEAVGAGDDLGTVEAGKLADLVVLDGNPLEEIGRTRGVRTVIRNGRVHDVEELLGEPARTDP